MTISYLSKKPFKSEEFLAASNARSIPTDAALLLSLVSSTATISFVLSALHFNRELKQRRRRRRLRGRRLVKKEFIFYKRNSRLSRFVRYSNGSKNVLQLHMQRRRSIPNGNTKN